MIELHTTVTQNTHTLVNAPPFRPIGSSNTRRGAHSSSTCPDMLLCTSLSLSAAIHAVDSDERDLESVAYPPDLSDDVNEFGPLHALNNNHHYHIPNNDMGVDDSPPTVLPPTFLFLTVVRSRFRRGHKLFQSV